MILLALLKTSCQDMVWETNVHVSLLQLEMEDEDTIDVFQQQTGGVC